MKMKNMKIRFMAAACIMILFTGCQSGQEMEEGKNIALKDPVSIQVNSEPAVRRTITDAKIFTGFVFPKTKEYGFAGSVRVSGTEVYPGNTVTSGDVLAYSDLSDYEKSIKEKKEAFETFVKTHEDYVESATAQLSELTQRMNQMNKSSTEYEIVAKKKEALALELEKEERLYALDYEYEKKNLDSYIANMTESCVVSDMEGTVVAVGGIFEGRYDSGPYLGSYTTKQGEPVIAVADINQLHIKCGYMARTVVSKAKEVYALINGERFEIEYEPMSTEEYNEQKQLNGTVYTTFHFVDTPKEVKVGDFVTIIVINASDENVISVSNSAIRKDEKGKYVYVLKEGKSVYTSIQTGLSDKLYTAVLSGLQEGDEVLGAESLEYGSKVATIEKGDFKTEYTAEGMVVYTKAVSVTSEITYGTVHYEGAKVQNYQSVKKGDVLATVRVEMDENELQKQKTQLERLEQRLEDFIAAGTKGKEKELEQKQKEIAEQKALIDKMNQDSITTQIVAPTSGVIVWLLYYAQNGTLKEGDEIATIADVENCYIMAENSNQQLNLGLDVAISYKTELNKNAEVTGKVVSLSSMGVSNSISSNYAFISVPLQDIGDFAKGISNNMGRCTVAAYIREMKNVLIIPRTAVTDIAGTPYVTIKNSDGTVTTQSFVAGGYNNENYWVAAGLMEGMEICLR